MSRTEKRLVMGRVVARPRMLAHECPASRRKCESTLGRANFGAAALLGALGVVSVAAQEPPRIRVAPEVIAAAASQAALAIEVGPLGAVPPRSFLSLNGLPPTVTLIDAHAVRPGTWAVSLASSPTLKAMIPAGLSGQSEVTISLIAIDGRLLAQAKTTLVIQRSPGARTSSPIERTEHAGPHPPTPERGERALAPPDTQRALAFLKKGEESFAAGNVSAARLFYERAADAGLAEGALALAATFDADELARRQVLGGVQPDQAAARRWYERARELGALEAEKHLRRLGARDR